MMHLLRATLAGLGFLSACRTQQSTGTPGFRDSAGVRIVSYSPQDVPALTWTVDSAPRLLIGTEQADPSPLLLAPVGAFRLSDGSIVVADRATSSLKYFDSVGHLTRVVGRSGHGPGEFEFIAWLKSCGTDSAFVFDLGSNQVSVIPSTGTVARRFGIRTLAGGPAFGVECSRTGHYVLAAWPELDAKREPGPFRPLVTVGLAGADGTAKVALGNFPGTEMVVRGRGMSPRAVGRWLRMAIGDSTAWVAPNATRVVYGYDLAGRLRIHLFPAVREIALSAREWDYQRQTALDSAGSVAGRQRVTQLFSQAGPPDQLPPVHTLLVDQAELLWIQPHHSREEPNPAWQVYRATGEFLATVRLPSPLKGVLGIGQDWVLGLQEDSDGADVVALYRLQRSGANGP